MRLAAAILTLCCAAPAPAKTASHVVDVTVTAKNIYGREFTQPIKVTIFRDDQRERSPLLILNHGRAGTPEGQKAMGRAAYSENSRYFVARGFAVFVPTRVGYGVSGGDDVEYSGTCWEKNYPPVYEAAAQQTLQVVAYARTLPYIDTQRWIAVGQSFGGTTAIAVAAKNVEGFAGAVNFAGGGGGDPVRRAGEPCRPDLLRELFASYAGAKAPTLWLYSENDQWMGKRYPRQWFDAFVARGGKGRFVQLPAHGEDGHASFTRNAEAWRPAFEDFLRANGF